LASPSPITPPFCSFDPSQQHYKGAFGFSTIPRTMSSSSFPFSGLANLDQYPLSPGTTLDQLLSLSHTSPQFLSKADQPQLQEQHIQQQQQQQQQLQMTQQLHQAQEAQQMQLLQQQQQQQQLPIFEQQLQHNAFLAASANAVAADVAVANASVPPPPPPAAPIEPAFKVPKKNHYPCPVSKQYDCSEHFTTSGHAARHAKKHTGKKDAICPECNKAFTRKDNMEQHRRTHSNFRSANIKTTATVEEQKARKLKQQQQKAAAVQRQQDQQVLTAAAKQYNAEQQRRLKLQQQQQQQQQQQLQMAQQQLQAPPLIMDSAADLVLDPQLRESEALYTNADDLLAALQQQQAPYPNMLSRPSLQRSNFTQSLDLSLRADASSTPIDPPSPVLNLITDAPSPSMAPALDALALAASRQAD